MAHPCPSSNNSSSRFILMASDNQSTLKAADEGGSQVLSDNDMMRITTTDTNVLKKDLSWLGTMSVGFNVSNSWLVIAATMTISLMYGPMNTIWGIMAITPIYFCIGLTLAELVSAYPTTGGQYHWTSILAPPSINKQISYICGILSWFSWICMSASSSSAVILCVEALIAHSNPAFAPKGWQNFLIYQAVIAVSLAFCLFGTKIKSAFYVCAFVLSLAAFFVFSFTEIGLAKTKQSSAVVWTTYTQGSGWSPGTQFLIALAAPAVAFCPVDGAVHLVEEVKHARRVVPRVIITALSISFVTSIVFALATLYSIPDYDALLTSHNFVLYEIWHQISGGEVVPVVFTCVIMVLLPVGSIASFQVAGLMTMSLGRDKALPLSRQLRKIHPQLNAPVYSLFVIWAVLFLIGCLHIFSSLAFNSIVGITVVFQQITIAMPTAFLLYRCRRAEALPPYRTFALPGLVGWTANLITFSLTVITTVFFFFPAVLPATVETMNYACVVAGGVLLIGTVNWFAFARKHYDGPATIEIHE